ncbi:hypothetical protein F2Q70_00035729 [Brassica cretica]|nr:hypothetical protein F2Q70_00035729 [Brassica cretica]
MDVELPPHSFPSKDATLPDDQTCVEKAGSPMVEPNPTFPNVPLGGPHVLLSTEEAQTTGNPNPSEVVEKRTSKRLRTLSVPFSPPQPQPRRQRGKEDGRKQGSLKAANAKLIREGNCVQHTEVAAGENVATVDANKKVEVELIKAAEREKMLCHCLTISWAGFIIATAIIASRCLK